MKNIITQALITMGYRKASDSIFLKPIGFCILIAEIIYPNDNEGISVNIKLGFNHHTNGELNIWGHQDFSWDSNDINVIKDKLNIDENRIYEEICIEIAFAEAYVGIEHCNMHHNYKTFAFKTDNDIIQLVNL